MMLLIDYCKKHNRAKAYLIVLAQEGKLPTTKKVMVERTETSRNGGKCTKQRPMWVIEDEEAVTEYLNKRAASRYNPILREGWTRSSLECYKARLICHKCPNYQVCKGIESYTHTKPIKQKTIELVKTYGIPPERINE